MVDDPPAALKFRALGLNFRVQPPGSWSTTTVRPAIVTVPLNSVVLVLGRTESKTFPLPVPALVDTMVINGSSLSAVHEHDVPITFTLTLLLPPFARNKMFDTLVVKKHAFDPCATITLNVHV